jgi:hypothetical protein
METTNSYNYELESETASATIYEDKEMVFEQIENIENIENNKDIKKYETDNTNNTVNFCEGCTAFDMGEGGKNQQQHYGGCIPDPFYEDCQASEEDNENNQCQENEEAILLDTNILLQVHFRENPTELKKAIELFNIEKHSSVWEGVLNHHEFNKSFYKKKDDSPFSDPFYVYVDNLLSNTDISTYIPINKESYGLLRKNMYEMEQNHTMTNTNFMLKITCCNVYDEEITYNYGALFNVKTLDEFKECVFKNENVFYIPLRKFKLDKLFHNRLDENENKKKYDMNFICDHIITV